MCLWLFGSLINLFRRLHHKIVVQTNDVLKERNIFDCFQFCKILEIIIQKIFLFFSHDCPIRQCIVLLITVKTFQSWYIASHALDKIVNMK